MADFDPDAFIKAAGAGAGDGFDPDAFLAAHAAQSEPGYLDWGLGGIAHATEKAGAAAFSGLAKLGSTLDSYGGAPVRAAIGSLQDGGSLSGAAGALKGQFGADPRLAPTGRDIARKAGVSDAPVVDTPQAVLDATNEAARMDPYAALGAGYMNAAKAIPRSAAAGAAIGVATDPLTYVPVGKIAETVAGPIQGALRGAASPLWVKATGATGKQAAEFAPEAADAIRASGASFGNGPAQIAAKAQAAIDAAEASKQAMVSGPLAGATVDRNAIYNAIRAKIADLSGDESQLGVVRQLDAKLQDITGVAHQNGAIVPLAKSEEIRRGFDKAAKWSSSSDADALEANKITANIYRDAGENAATAVDPKLGAQYKADKTTQANLIDIEKAAGQRALQLQQSPHGGLLDIAAVTGGGGLGGHIGEALGGPAGRIIGTGVGGGVGFGAKMLRPRYASMGAASLDALAAAPAAAMTSGGSIAARGANLYRQGGPAVQPGDDSTTAPGPIGNTQAAANRSPAVGEAKWAQDGLSKLGIQDAALSSRLMQDPKARQLLIQASDLTPGSKAMQKIMDQIKGISK